MMYGVRVVSGVNFLACALRRQWPERRENTESGRVVRSDLRVSFPGITLLVPGESSGCKNVKVMKP